MNTKMTLEKRILSVLLTVIMVFSMVPLSVFAADDYAAEVTIGNTTTPYSDIVQAFNAAKYASGSVTVKLLNDIDSFATGFSRADGVQFSSGDVTLDLNGHYLEKYNNAAGTDANKRAVFYVTGSAKMTVMDSVGGGEIIQPLNDPALIVDSNASLIVQSGTITGRIGCGIRIDSGILTVEGGTIKSEYDEGIYVGGGTVSVTGSPKIHGEKSNALLITGESTVTLSGGTYTTNEKNKRSILTTVGKVTDFLADGFRFTDSNGLDIAITEDGQGTDSDNVTVSDFGIKYIDADGTEQKCTSFTELTDASQLLSTGWYAISGDVSGRNLGISGNATVNIILCDGATLNLQNTLYMFGGSTLNIYGQSGGTGALTAIVTSGQAAIGIMSGTAGGTGAVNIYGGTVTAQASYGAQPIGINPGIMTGKVNVTIGTGMKCVKTDDQNTAYAYDNTDGTSITITKCTDHKWSYSNITGSTHDQTCDLCGTAETGAAHTTASYKYRSAGDTVHHLICACGKDYGTEYHTYTYAPNSDGLTHTATCICGYAVNDIEHTYKGEDKKCICGAVHSATYDGKNYASLQSAIDAAAPVGGTVTLAQQINENVVFTNGTVTVDLGGNRWSADTSDSKKGYVPLTVNGGSVTLKNGNLFQGCSGSSARTGIVINGGSVTVEEDARVMGGVPDINIKCPSITLNGGTLVLKEGAALLTGLQVPEGKVPADYLPEGTAFVKCSYDYDSNTVTISDPQEFVPDVYTANKITEGMAVLSHTHDFISGVCPCGFNCEHGIVDEATGRCENCNAQVYVATLTKADGTKQNYASFTDAWSEAAATAGATLKLLCDLDLGSSGDYLLEAGEGNFTLDLGSRTLEGSAVNSIIRITGAADIKVINGKIENKFDGIGSSLSPTGANAVRAESGATVTLEGVEFTPGSNAYQRGSAVCIINGTLEATGSVFNGMVMLLKLNGEISVKLSSSEFCYGITYGYGGTEREYETVGSFCADGNMFFDGDGKYIDTTDDNLWDMHDAGEYKQYNFCVDGSCSVQPHTHTYADGVCSECSYACPHDSGKNDREAGYFEKAICSICHCEYGDFVKDTIEPTGEIKIKERTWWQSLLNTISFGLFYKEEITVEITATDDSYSQPGYDESKHAVKIEYFISTEPLSGETVKKSGFNEYTEPFVLSDDNQYVIYAKLTDHAGNVSYASTDGFEIDTTAPVIENMTDGGHYTFCKKTTIKINEKNIDKVTLDGDEEYPDSNGQIYLRAYNNNEHTLIVTDKAGNTLTVYITGYTKHEFDGETLTCRHCGIAAAAKLTADDFTGYYATVNDAISDGFSYQRENMVVTLLRTVEYGTPNASDIGLWSCPTSFTLDLNGYSLGGGYFRVNAGYTGTANIISSKPGGALLMFVNLKSPDATVIMGEGLGSAAGTSDIFHDSGTLKIYYGKYHTLYVGTSGEKKTELYGGKFAEINITSEGVTCADLLAPEYRYEGISYADAKAATVLQNVTVVPCSHDTLDENGRCTGCGFHLVLSVEKDGVIKNFETFEAAISYAGKNDGCTVKLMQDLLLDMETVGSMVNIDGYIELNCGTYTLDLAGKTLTIGDLSSNFAALTVYDGCNVTITDTIGSGKVKSLGAALEVRSGSRLTIEGGDYSGLSKVLASEPDSLTIKGGKFKLVASKESKNPVSPLNYLADGCAFMLDNGKYASESNVKSEYISPLGTTYWIEGVTVVPAPLTIDEQPTDLKFYLTSQEADKYVKFVISAIEKLWGGTIMATLEKEDGTVVEKMSIGAYENLQKSLSAVNFTVSDSGSYRIKFELNGYVLYSNIFTVTVAECEHPGYDENTHKCTQCGCDLAAVITKDGKTTGYATFAEALAAAQTEKNKGCTLKLLADVSGTVAVKSGTFTLDATNRVVDGKLNIAKGADFTVSGGVITGNVICAKGGKLTAVKSATFTGAINCVGEGDFRNCQLAGTVAGKGSLKLNSCEIPGGLSVSGGAEAKDCIVSGTVTVNNGGSFKSTGDTYRNTINVKSGGTLEIVSGICDGKVTAEEGSKLIVSGGSYADVAVENNVDFTLNNGKFKKITVVGKHLIDYLKDGMALEDMDNGDVIDGRVGIAGNVKVVSHTHTCIWKTDTHEKLCGCGYVEATDTEAPVISGIEPNKAYYGPTDFTVTDENDFTVWLDGKPITPENGKYTVAPDNKWHIIKATDVAGNTVSLSVAFYKIYTVTLPTGEGYTVNRLDSDETTVRHGDSYTFVVQIATGYSKTGNYKVLVNGKEPDNILNREDGGSYKVYNVSEDLVITVEGIADITSPEVELDIHANTFKDFLNRITFGLFFKESQTVCVTAKDYGSGINKVEYLLSETAFTGQDAITGGWTELTLNDKHQAYFNIEPGRKAFVYVRVTDMSGNITVVNSDGVVVYTDAEAITEAVGFTKQDDADVSFDVRLNGNTVAALYNGNTLIDSSSYTVSADRTVTLKNSYLSTLTAGEYTIHVEYNPLGEIYKNGDEPAMTSVKLTVEKRTPILDHMPSDGKIYDGNSIGIPTFNTDSDGTRTFEYKRADEDDTAYTDAAPKNVGKYTIRITTSETDTFKAASSTMEFEIQPREVAIFGVKVADKTYDGTTHATIANSGTLSVNYDGDDLVIVAGSASYDNKNVGKSKTVAFTGFVLSGSAAGNYRLTAQPTSVTADITARKITINGATVEASKIYDGTTDAKITSNGTPSENFDGDNLTIVAGSATYDNKNVGTGKTVTFAGFALAGDAAANYKLTAQPASVTADITVREITISGATVEAGRIYDGTTDAKITSAGTLSDNYDGDNLTIIAGKAAYDNKNAGKGKTVTFTGFTLSGSAAGNYKLAAQPAGVTADITVREIKIVGTAVEASKVYDGNMDAKITAAGTFDGLVKDDDVTIVTGKAAYGDKNVGAGKTVTFTGFTLAGDDAENYVLSAQPSGITAGITPKELTIADLKVRDKQYDGKNTAEIDGTPALAGVVDGDVLRLVNGIPTFDSVKIGKNIPISFTAFTLYGDSVTVGNYTLTQPGGITANIVEYVADGSEYDVNSRNWINTDFIITAKDGYKLSLTDTADGEWSDMLTASDETGKGRLTFYVKNTATGVISAAVTENYRIDRTAPTGEVRLNERTAFQESINKITFGLFFKDAVNVRLTAKDEASGVKSVRYFMSDRIFTDEEVRAITDWTDNSDFDIEAKDMDKFVIYVRIEDNAGNVTFIGSDGATFDTTAPKIVGVDNDKTYYVTKKVTVEDINFESVTLNGGTVSETFTLTGDTEAVYVIRAVDKAGNMTEYMVTMKPISSITDAISGITVDNVRSDDAEMISSVERQILDLREAFDDGESTDDERNKLTEAAAKCKELSERISNVADEITRLTDGVNGYEIDEVTSADKADIEKLITDIDTLLDGDNLTDAERVALEAMKDTARALLDRIAAAKDAAEAEEIKAVNGITGDTVKLEDKEVLEKAEKALENALRDFGGNYTEEENKDLEAKLEIVKAALAAIGNAEKAAGEIGRLPSADDAKLSDKSGLDRVKEILAGLTENEKAMLGKDAIGKIDALAEKIQKLDEEAGKSDSVKTGDTNNLALWIALLFISGGVVTGTAVVIKKKEHSVK